MAHKFEVSVSSNGWEDHGTGYRYQGKDGKPISSNTTAITDDPERIAKDVNKYYGGNFSIDSINQVESTPFDDERLDRHRQSGLGIREGFVLLAGSQSEWEAIPLRRR